MGVTVAQRVTRYKGIREIIRLGGGWIYDAGGAVLLAGSLHVAPEGLKGGEHPVIGIMCVATAGIGQQKDPRPGKLHGG